MKKRSRDDPNEYLGGDLSFGLTKGDAGDGDTEKTRAQRNELRKFANKVWKNSDRKVGSGKDPNPRHTQYYKTQLPCLVDEWETFQASLCEGLPVTFRFGGICNPMIEACISRLMSQDFKTMRGRYVEINGKAVKDNIVGKVSWCDAWQVAADSATLSRSEGLAPLSNYLKREVDLGHIVRQELASMIPVLLLDVHHDHCVLDVCSAPGSKTEQILATMKQNAEENGLKGAFSGMVVANDADPKRIQTLRRRYSRCGWPNLLIHCSRAEDLCKALQGKYKFDRIVADVPCSGDGTFRKFPHLWRLFRPRISLELHMLQLQIAKSSAIMLRTGGRMVYSTCSINPLEDEAVVAALLIAFEGRLQLVDIRKEGLLPGLKSRPGLSTWRCDEEIFTVGEPDEASRNASIARLPKFTQSMHPPSLEVARGLHLERCLRILPHDQDTGGFFVAVLEKIPPATANKPSAKAAAATSSSISAAAAAAAAASSGSNKDIVSRVSEEQSLKTLKSLGFNPKTLNSTKQKQGEKPRGQAVSAAASAENSSNDAASGDTKYESLSDDDFSRVQEVLQLEDDALGLGLLPAQNDQTGGNDKRKDGRCSLVISSSVIVEEGSKPKDAAKGHGGNQNPDESAAMDDHKKPKSRKNKKPRYNGIFGSKSEGWIKRDGRYDSDDDNDDDYSDDDYDENDSDSDADDHEHGHGNKKSGDRLKAAPYKAVQLVSPTVERALSTWANGVTTVQAGVTVAKYRENERDRNEREGFYIDTDGVRAISPYVKSDSTVHIGVKDFTTLARVAAVGQEEHKSPVITLRGGNNGHIEAAGSDDDEDEDGGCPLSPSGQTLLWEAVQNYISGETQVKKPFHIFVQLSSSNCVTDSRNAESAQQPDGKMTGSKAAKGGVTVTASDGDDDHAAGGDVGGTEKRRMSKAERKKLKQQQQQQQKPNKMATGVQNSKAAPRDVPTEISTAAGKTDFPLSSTTSLSTDGMLLTVQVEVIDARRSGSGSGSGGLHLVNLKVVSPKDLCESYCQTISTLKLGSK